MPKLPFAKFQMLIDGVGDLRLYDSVKPQVQTYAENVLSHLSREDAFRKLFELANSSSTGQAICVVSDTVAAIERMGKGKDGRGTKYETKRVHVEKFYYFFVFGCDDPTYGDRISTKLFRKPFHTKFESELRSYGVPRPSHLPSEDAIRLGDFSVSLSLETGVRELTLLEPENRELDTSGELGVLKALDWRARLTSMHGRDAERDEIVEWAMDGESDRITIALLSGPGGSGKTRLAAEAVRRLKDEYGWSGGFLPAVVNPGDTFSGVGKGVVVIVDYPEQRYKMVKELIAAALDDHKLKKRVCILLTSRESLQSWEEALGTVRLDAVKVIRLENSPYLSDADALRIAQEVSNDYPLQIGRAKAHFSGVENWLGLDESHRLPLMVLAASVHAVLEPEDGFSLVAADVLVSSPLIQYH